MTAANAQPASLPTLLSIIQARGTELQAYLDKHGLPAPGFAPSSPSPDYIPADDAAIQAARAELIDAARTLADLAAAPARLLAAQCFVPSADAFALQVLDSFDVPLHVPLQGSIAYADLAAACGLDEAILRRIVRFSATAHFLAEPEPGRVAHSTTSRLVVEDATARHFVGNSMKILLPSDAGGLEALRRWGGELSPTQCGLAAVHGKSAWDLLKENKEYAAHFNGTMEFGAKLAKMGADPDTTGGFDWTWLPAGGKVVDCGGGVGHVSKMLAEEHPGLTFVVQDLPEVIAQVEDKQTLGGRVTFSVHSFFDAQPIEDADAYFFRRILHDWTAKDAKRIIETLIPSMKIGSRLVIWDHVLPMPGSIASTEENYSRAQDVQMMVMLGAQERSLDEWKALFSDASGSKLRLESHAPMLLSFIRED